MSSLYRQYRPQRFEEISGQTHITETLKAAVSKNKIHHAYLFQGPRGTGKTTTARILAKRLNCADPKGAEPCGECPTCVATQENRNLDIVEIDAASNRGIDDIRALRERVGLSPTQGTYKVYIIDEVHMLTNEAFAALLKTLEEPFQHVVFILATTELHKVPATILSRCQVFRFRRATDKEMRNRLSYLLKQEERKTDDAVIDFVIKRSDGCYRDAESLLGQMLTAHEGKITLDTVTQFLGLPSPELIQNFLASLVASDRAKAIDLVDQAYSDGFDPEQFIQESIREARDAILTITKQSPDIPEFAKHPSAATRLTSVIRALIQATQDISFVPQPIIALHLAVLTACGPTQQATQPAARPAGASAPKPTPSFTPQPAPKQQIQQPAQPTVSVKKEEVVVTATSGEAPAVSFQKVADAWSQVIDKVKETNPVSSTFLRATEPIAVEGRVVTLRVQFPLHKNFFDKAPNKALIEQTLTSVLETELSVRCHLEQSTKTIAEQQAERQQKEQELLKNVQDVFGIKA